MPGVSFLLRRTLYARFAHRTRTPTTTEASLHRTQGRVCAGCGCIRGDGRPAVDPLLLRRRQDRPPALARSLVRATAASRTEQLRTPAVWRSSRRRLPDVR